MTPKTNDLTREQRIKIYGFDPEEYSKKDLPVTINDILAEILTLESRDKDLWILITGNERSGKSTVAFRVCKQADPSFNFERPAFSTAEFKSKHVQLPPNSCLVMDESTKGGFNRDALTKTNKDLVKYAVVCGERNIANFILFPNIQWVDPYFRNQRLHYWFHVSKQGLCDIYKPIRSPFHSETYWLYQSTFEFEKEESADWNAYEKRKHEMVGNDAARLNPDAKELPSKSQVFLEVQPWIKIASRILESD